MNLLNYIGEFFLFRWLFGFHKHNETRRNVSDTTIDPSNSDFVDDFYDEQDDYDMMDDDF